MQGKNRGQGHEIIWVRHVYLCLDGGGVGDVLRFTGE